MVVSKAAETKSESRLEITSGTIVIFKPFSISGPLSPIRNCVLRGFGCEQADLLFIALHYLRGSLKSFPKERLCAGG
jgi:hypothetical protein